VDALFGVGGGTGSNQSAERDAVVESVHFHCYGCDGSSSTLSSDPVHIGKAAEIAREVKGLAFSARQGARQVALLKHYRQVE
jgi:hypothetical protein